MSGAPAKRPGWSLQEQAGRTFLITGATSGIGREAAFALASAGARVVLAGRSPEKLAATAAAIGQSHPGAELERLVIDLASLDSVRAAGADAQRLGPIDVLVNNAGLMGGTGRSVDGLDLMAQTNHFAPFLFTGLLLPQLLQGERPRVVNVASLAHLLVRRAHVGDPYRRRREPQLRSYGRTKLANLLTTLELQRRSDRAGLGVLATAAHPGVAATNLVHTGREIADGSRAARLLDAALAGTTQSAAAGAAPTLVAATADLRGGSYVGPDGFLALRGRPVVQRPSRAARNEASAAALWELSERVVGLSWP